MRCLLMNVAYKFVADKLTNIATPKGTEPSKCQANFMLDVSFLHVFLLWSVGKEVKKKFGKFCEKSREKSGEIGWGKSQEKSWQKRLRKELRKMSG